MELQGYRFIKKLGNQHRRKFGNVYFAESIENDEQVVIKHNQITSSNTNEIERLRGEQVFSFEQNGLPKVINFIETSSDIYLIKRFQPGIPLDHFWKTIHRKMRLLFIKMLVEKLSNILTILHSQNIFHCDLKPSNILINGTHDNFELELIDFGLAIQQPIAHQRSLLFPLGYAAPELILNDLEIVNATTDYFSFGIIIWKLYNDQLPCMHHNPSIYTNLQLTYPLEDQGLPKGMFKIVEKLTQKPKFKTAPNRMKLEDVRIALLEAQALRYQSSKQLVTDIQSLKEKRFFGI